MEKEVGAGMCDVQRGNRIVQTLLWKDGKSGTPSKCTSEHVHGSLFLLPSSQEERIYDIVFILALHFFVSRRARKTIGKEFAIAHRVKRAPGYARGWISDFV